MHILKTMLYEDDVIEAVCQHLKQNGFEISEQNPSTKRGDDIVARGTGSIRDLCIEAKGETSKRKSSSRYGNEFNGGQVRDHVANAFYRAAKMATSGKTGGIAFPSNDRHRKRISDIEHALNSLGIIVSGLRRIELFLHLVL